MERNTEDRANHHGNVHPNAPASAPGPGIFCAAQPLGVGPPTPEMKFCGRLPLSGSINGHRIEPKQIVIGSAQRSKLEQAIRRAIPKLPAELRSKVEGLLTPEALGILAGMGAIWVGAQFVGAGEIIDVVILGIGTFYLGTDAIRAGRDLAAFFSIVTRAQTEADLDRAADHFARAVATVGVDGLLVLITKMTRDAVMGRSTPTRVTQDVSPESASGVKLQPRYRTGDSVPLEPSPAGPRLRPNVARNWVDESGDLKWPPKNGAVGPEQPKVLQPGMTIDRFGGEGGTFASTPEASYAQRSLPYDATTVPHHQYEVLKPIPCMQSEAAPWFGEPGGAPQYRFDSNIRDLVDQGYLRRVK